MLARHPSTGQPIRILRTERQVTADHKTLVWVRDTFAPSHRWAQRWYAVVDTVDAAVRVCMGHPCAAIYISNVTDDWVTHFSTLFQDPATLLVCSSAARTRDPRLCLEAYDPNGYSDRHISPDWQTRTVDTHGIHGGHCAYFARKSNCMVRRT